MYVVIFTVGARGWVAAVTGKEAEAESLLAKWGGSARGGRVEKTSGDSFPFFILEDGRGFSFPDIQGEVNPASYAVERARQGFSGTLYVIRSEWIGSPNGSDRMGVLEHHHF
jgi:hypothetical protein